MTLGRLFSILGASLAAFLIALNAGLYFIAAGRAGEAAAASARQFAERSAGNLERAVGLAAGILDQLALDPAYAAALASGDPARVAEAEERLSRVVPGASRVRLLADDIEAPDESKEPKMGFADLDLVRKARAGKPQPAMHAANTPDAHIALARHLGAGNGVILASLAPKSLLSALPVKLDAGALELKQQDLSLAYLGDAALKPVPSLGVVPVTGTPWTLFYWEPRGVDPGVFWFILLTVTAAAAIGGGAALAFLWSSRALHQDQDDIVALVHDLLIGKNGRRPNMRIRDMHRLVDQLESLRHTAALENRQQQPKTAGTPAATRQRIDLDNPLAAIVEPLSAPPPQRAPIDGPPVAVSPTIFRAYDIRGVVGDTLTPEVVHAVGRAIGSEARDRGEYTVAIARDGRLSSPDLAEALGRGLMASGCSVIDLGLVPTPVLYFATHVLNTESGVMVTGSHNPPNYNGLKIVIAGETLAEKDIQKLRTRVSQNDFHSGRGNLEFRSLVPDYIERIVQDTAMGRDMKIVVDCGNGATGNIAPVLLTELGCEIVPLFCEVDGNFPNHHPDPSNPKNLAALIDAVQEHQADLGIAFDGDGDRLGVVDSAGNIIWPDRQMMVFAADVLSREPGSDIIFDVKCTRHLAAQIVKSGGRPLMWKTGHSLIKAKIKETGALLAGEMSGHIFFKERWYGFDDGLYAAARLLEILSNDDRPSAEVFAELPDAVNTPELNIAVKEGENAKIVKRLQEIADFPDARITDIDGLRVDFADGWGLIRASNTTPSLVLRFEADSAEALARIMGEFRALLHRIKPDLEFPLTIASR